MDFNKERFVNFAKYDLAINKSFYRNLSLATIVGTFGIALFGFMIRWNIWQNYASEYSLNDESFDTFDFAWDCSGTSACLLVFCTLMLTGFCGCWAHNLRSRQNRIMELTLPAANIEKFVWHLVLTVGGGALLVVLSALLADGLNALLCLFAMPKGAEVPSLIARMWSLITFSMIEGAGVAKALVISLCLCSYILQLAFYIYGNSLKYKFNIILTYAAEQVISLILSIIFITIVTSIHTHWYISMSDDEVETMFEYIIYGISAIEIILAAVFVWLSYRNYVKAQLITPLNK
ncbi:MAG: hypothetical protein J1F40_08600 [Prevotellaceae bacterium]|nr:hypothetical protein [Prevotellaceae bacterium]